MREKPADGIATTVRSFPVHSRRASGDRRPAPPAHVQSGPDDGPGPRGGDAGLAEAVLAERTLRRGTTRHAGGDAPNPTSFCRSGRQLSKTGPRFERAHERVVTHLHSHSPPHLQ